MLVIIADTAMTAVCLYVAVLRPVFTHFYNAIEPPRKRTAELYDTQCRISAITSISLLREGGRDDVHE